MTDLAELLRGKRDDIVAHFILEVARTNLPPHGLSRPMLIDHVPRFLDEIVMELERRDVARTSFDTLHTSRTGAEHGEQRWTLGYDLESLIREYGVLRHCILDALKKENVAPTIDEFDILAKCLNVGVAAAASAYVKYRDSQLAEQNTNLEFLAEAGQLLSSSLDYRSTLNRLTGLIVPRMADWCAVHLEGEGEMPIAHVDHAKVPLLRALYERFPLPQSSAYGYRSVIRTGEPQLVQVLDPKDLDALAQNDEHRELLRQVSTSSWMVLPLRVQGTMFGALTLAYSDSGRHYAPSDLTFAGELARRAAVAIDNARLYELSQHERSRVEAATRAKDEFVAMVSHELRTPLNAILGWLRLVRSGTLDESKKAHAFEVIERNARAQSQLVADLLDISRVITGKIRINPAQVDLSNVVDMAVEVVRPAAEAKRISIQMDLDRSGAILRGDADRLQQIVWNLLANAVKFTPKNGIVRVVLRRVESDLELCVEDSGEGIDPHFLPHVFESFRQSDTSLARPHGGLGIGLSIAKHLVELHGGSIEARSRGKGEGATFRVLLPISPLVSTTFGVARVPATTEPRIGVALPTGLDGIRVLLVDDDDDARELVRFVLDGCGMDVTVAGTAEEALDQLAKATPHIVISDIGMPVEDGYSLIRSIRTLSDPEKASVPTIALTAFARSEDRTRALVEGFNLHIAKPVEPDALVRAVIDLAGHKKT